MLSRCVSFRTAWLPALGASLLLTSSVVAVSAQDRVRLGVGVLALSRGSTQCGSLAQWKCNALQGNPACFMPYAPCTSCAMPTYTVGVPQINGGYTAGAPGGGSCGANWTGYCNSYLNCIIQKPGPICAIPPGSPTIQ
jgi:hypothetical protein